MGQTQSTDNQVNSCFRNCMKENNSRSPRKTIAQVIKIYPKTSTEQQKTLNLKQQQQKFLQKVYQQSPIETTHETSLYNRLRMQEHNSQSYQSNDYPRKNILSDNQLEDIQADLQFLSATLGIESKFQCKKQNINSRQRNSTRISSNYEKGTTLNHGTYNGKLYGQKSQSTTRSTKTINRTKSNKVLINKIEQIKKKYYQRQLQLQIYKSQKEYQDQIRSIVKVEQYVHKNHIILPVQSINQISIIKGKIQNQLEQSKMKIDASLMDNSIISLTQNPNIDNNILYNLQLESRDAKLQQEQQELQSKSRLTKKGLHKFRRQQTNKSLEQQSINQSINNQSINQSLNKSLNKSINRSMNNRSLNNSQNNIDESQNKIQFSQYSQQNLQEIKQLDEEEDEYKSNVVNDREEVIRNQLVSKLQSVRQNRQCNLEKAVKSKHWQKMKCNSNYSSNFQELLEVKEICQHKVFSRSKNKRQEHNHDDNDFKTHYTNQKTELKSNKPPDISLSASPKNHNILLF